MWCGEPQIGWHEDRTGMPVDGATVMWGVNNDDDYNCLCHCCCNLGASVTVEEIVVPYRDCWCNQYCNYWCKRCSLVVEVANFGWLTAWREDASTAVSPRHEQKYDAKTEGMPGAHTMHESCACSKQEKRCCWPFFLVGVGHICLPENRARLRCCLLSEL